MKPNSPTSWQVCALFVSGCLVASAPLQAASLTDLQFSVVVPSGLTQPTSVVAGPGTDRLFITERSGKIRVVQNGVLQPQPFLDLSSLVNSSSERGLFSVAFAPDFARSGTLYAAYCEAPSANLVVSRIVVDPNATSVAAVTPSVIVNCGLGNAVNHHGGWIGFAPSDTAGRALYVSVGDGSEPVAAQNFWNSAGKILRVDTTSVQTPAPGNPFLSNADASDDLVFAYGLRNVWKASFDRATGDLYLGDVGNNSREEINVLRPSDPAGRNYGWLYREGAAPNPGYSGSVPSGLTDPQLDYAHDPATGLGFALSASYNSASVTTGFTYRGSEIPFLQGQHLFGDFSSGRFAVFTYDRITDTASAYTEITATLNPALSNFGRFQLVAFGEDNAGEIYALSYGNGQPGSGRLLRLTVIPEPTAIALLAPALLATLHRRRSR